MVLYLWASCSLVCYLKLVVLVCCFRAAPSIGTRTLGYVVLHRPGHSRACRYVLEPVLPWLVILVTVIAGLVVLRPFIPGPAIPGLPGLVILGTVIMSFNIVCFSM